MLVNITPAIGCYGSIVAHRILRMSQSVHLLVIMATITLNIKQIPESGNYQKIPNK
jgi:hypothetical protein